MGGLMDRCFDEMMGKWMGGWRVALVTFAEGITATVNDKPTLAPLPLPPAPPTPPTPPLATTLSSLLYPSVIL